jgi:hypothetical protein
MKSIVDALREAHRALTAAGVDHALIGGLALGSLGVHRATIDIDFLVPGSLRDQARRCLEACGYRMERDSGEVMQFSGEIGIDLLLANREPTLDMLRRATVDNPLGVKSVAAEDLIGLKIQAYVNDRRRERQDKADIVAILRTCAPLDWARIEKYANLFGEWPAIDQLKHESEL